MVKFTKDMSKAVRNFKPPHRVTIDFVEFPDYIGIRTYENEVMSLSDEKQLSLMEYMHMIRKLIESYGVRCFFDGSPGDPPRSFK
jgi:hypothetical protein